MSWLSEVSPLAAYLINALPAAPTGLAAGAVTTTTVALTWNMVSNVTGYRVYSASDGYTTPVYDGATPATTIVGLTPNTAYHFKVSAYGVDGESVKSAAVDVTTAAASDGTADSTNHLLALGAL